MLPEYLKMNLSSSRPLPQNVVNFGDVRFTVITPSLIRIERGTFTDNATQVVICRNLGENKFSVCDEDGYILTINTGKLSLKYKKSDDFSADNLVIRLLERPYTEWHYGEKPLNNLGGTVCTLDQIDGECPIDDGICSVDGYSVIDDSASAILTEDGWFAKRDGDTEDLYFFGYGRDYERCVADYYKLTGVPEMLPAYALGNWWSRYFKYTEESYLALMDDFKEENVPISVGIIDMDWHLTDGDGREYVDDGWTGYTWNKDLFPDYKRFLSELKKRGLHTALNLHPAAGVRHWDDMYEEMAKRMGIDPATKHPVPFNCLSQEFWKAYFEVIHFPYEQSGVDFWWMDWQQGKDYSWMHVYDPEVNELECLDPLWMLNHMHFLASRRDGKRGLFFSRYAGFGSQRYPIGFSGDTVISWETLKFQPEFTATASNIGYSFWSHDIGGHMMGYRDDELNARWVQFGVFSPIFRIHSSNSPLTVREPWAFNAREEATIRRFMTMRHEIFPYLYTMCHRNYEQLIPTIRPMYHVSPESKNAYEVPDVYWFGSELVAAPITEKSDPVTLRGRCTVWLPEGRWVDWFTGTVYRGGEKFDAYRPIENMPLFLKAGAIVPTMKADGAKLLRAEALNIVVAAGADNEFTLYEDDGETRNYQNGVCCKTEMNLGWSDNKAVFGVAGVKGELSLIPEVRDYIVTFKGFKREVEIYKDGVLLDKNINQINGDITVNVGSVKSDKGFEITLICESGLASDNSDIRDKINDLIMRSQCMNNVKNTWGWIVGETFKCGRIDPTAYVGTPNDRLGPAIYELVNQKITARKPVPTPGLPKPIH